jgi:uncharacterized membrane protein
MKKILLCLFIFFSLSCFVLPALAQKQATSSSTQETFKARVTKIISDKQITQPVDTKTIGQQDIKLIGLSGNYKNKEIEVNTADAPDELVKNSYKAGDVVLVMYSTDDQGRGIFTITDFVRTNIILWLFIIFVVAVIAVGRFKGLRSLVSLAITFFIIIKYIVPQILDGSDPVIVTVFGSIAILISIIYITEGFNTKSHITALSIFISLMLTIFLSWMLVNMARLSGLSNEEAGFIATLGAKTLNLQGILLAGIIIGTLGALDDIVISQVVTVFELNEANPHQSRADILKKAFNVGVSHISAMTNTLFMAYAGAALPLLILFVSGQSSFASWDVAINNEMLATEIIRTLAGTIGIVLSVPTATILAVWYFHKKD